MVYTTRMASRHPLSQLRSPAKALADLVDKLEKLAHHHPDLPLLCRMIPQLAEEIALRGSMKALLKGASDGVGCGVGPCVDSTFSP